MRRIYIAILNLYPRDFRLRFRDEMLAAWDGRHPVLELTGLLRGVEPPIAGFRFGDAASLDQLPC